VRPSSTSARTSRGGCGDGSRTGGTEVVLRHAEVLERRARHPSPARCRYRQIRARWWRAASVRAELRHPRIPIRRGQRWLGDVDPAAFTAVVCHPIWTTGLVRVFSGAQPASPGVVWSSATPSTYRPASRTDDASVGQATSSVCTDATFRYDCRSFLTSWLADVAFEQRDLGTVPVYVPWVDLLFPAMPTAVGRCRRDRSVGAVRTVR
jgi:alpha-L-rhamnosidase